MVLAERGHVGARSKHTSDGELLAIVSLLIYARTVLINERSLLENIAISARELASLSHLRPNRWVFAIVDEVLACCTWPISEPDACVYCIEAWSIRVEFSLPIGAVADLATERTRYAHRLTDGRVMAKGDQVFTGCMTLKTFLGVHIKTSFQGYDIFAFLPSIGPIHFLRSHIHLFTGCIVTC